MSEYERFTNHNDHPSQSQHDLGSNVRMLFQGLTLAAVLWVASSLSSQNASIARLQEQIAELKTSLAGVPELTNRVTVLEQRQGFISDRQSADESMIDGNTRRAIVRKALK